MPVFSHRLVAILMIVALEAFMLAAILWLVAKLVGLLIMVETYVLASTPLVVLVLVESDVVVVVVEAYVLAAVLDWLLLFRPTNDEAAELRFSSASSCSAHSARRLPSELGTRLYGAASPRISQMTLVSAMM